MRVQRDPRRTIRSIRYFTGEHCLSSAQGITAPEATEATAAASRRTAGTPTHGYVDPRMLDWFERRGTHHSPEESTVMAEGRGCLSRAEPCIVVLIRLGAEWPGTDDGRIAMAAQWHLSGDYFE